MLDMAERGLDYIRGLKLALDSVSMDAVQDAAMLIWQVRLAGRRIYTCGNGGSALAAAHFATDLAKGTLGPDCDLTGEPFKVVSLADNISNVTAWANDTSYANIYRGQVRGLVERGDLVVGLSSSGNSPSVLEAIREARKRGASTIGLAGSGGGALADLVDVAIVVGSYDCGTTEAVHLAIIHMICSFFEDEFRREKAGSHLSLTTA